MLIFSVLFLASHVTKNTSKTATGRTFSHGEFLWVVPQIKSRSVESYFDIFCLWFLEIRPFQSQLLAIHFQPLKTEFQGIQTLDLSKSQLLFAFLQLFLLQMGLCIWELRSSFQELRGFRPPTVAASQSLFRLGHLVFHPSKLLVRDMQWIDFRDF